MTECTLYRHLRRDADYPFVSMVELTAFEFVQAGLFTAGERNKVIQVAARSNQELRP